MERYLADWCTSLNIQDQRDFDVWIGVDGAASKDTAYLLIGTAFRVNFVEAADEDTPVSLRYRALALLAADYDVVICTDSDDMLEPSRVSAALRGLECCDLYGCALGLINEAGQDLGIYFGLTQDELPGSILPYNNFLGLSNTAWRAEALLPCLSAPLQCIALDWLLATRAWGGGARITFDRTVRMRYRQYSANTASVMPPFSAEQIIRATDVVSAHYRLVTAEDGGIPFPQRHQLQQAAKRIDTFRETVLNSHETFNAYISALNILPPHRLWWLSVAHPALESIWNQ
jgi:hypothetical protein